jgi:hypothetical protein
MDTDKLHQESESQNNDLEEYRAFLSEIDEEDFLGMLEEEE